MSSLRRFVDGIAPAPESPIGLEERDRSRFRDLAEIAHRDARSLRLEGVTPKCPGGRRQQPRAGIWDAISLLLCRCHTDIDASAGSEQVGESLKCEPSLLVGSGELLGIREPHDVVLIDAGDSLMRCHDVSRREVRSHAIRIRFRNPSQREFVGLTAVGAYRGSPPFVRLDPALESKNASRPEVR
jgi:hypothetical protein